MNTKQTLLQQIDNFIKELVSIFPKNGDIILFGEQYNLIRSANSSLIIQYFIQYVYPHKTRIINQEESFFLEGGGQEELKENNGGLKFRDNIKNLWISEMSDQNKDIIWKYFKIFVILSEKYIIENMDS
jgi:hypothetical protein